MAPNGRWSCCSEAKTEWSSRRLTSTLTVAPETGSSLAEGHTDSPGATVLRCSPNRPSACSHSTTWESLMPALTTRPTTRWYHQTSSADQGRFGGNGKNIDVRAAYSG